MYKKKRWQFTLLIIVAALTLYNILPTLFFYTKPLQAPIDEPRANALSLHIVERIDALEDESISWLHSFCRLLDIRPSQIALNINNPERIDLSFITEADAQKMRKYLPRAGALIPFAPSQLSLYDANPNTADTLLVSVRRTIPVHFDTNELNAYMQFANKRDSQGLITPLYQALITDRLLQMVLCLGKTHPNTELAEAFISATEPQTLLETGSWIAERLVSFNEAFQGEESLQTRFFSSFAQEHLGKSIAPALIDKMNDCMRIVKQDIKILTEEEEKAAQEGGYLETTRKQQRSLLQARLASLTEAMSLIQEHSSLFISHEAPLTLNTAHSLVEESFRAMNSATEVQTIELQGRNPFIASIQLDWRKETLSLALYTDITAYQKRLLNTKSRLLDQAESLLFNELAFAARQTDENLQPSGDGYATSLSTLPDSKSFIALRLASIAEAKGKDAIRAVVSAWAPEHPDLQSSAFPIVPYQEWIKLPANQQHLSLIVYAPVCEIGTPEKGFRMNSTYLIAKGLQKMIAHAKNTSGSHSSRLFLEDMDHLHNLLGKAGYIGYEGALLNKDLANDYIFECPNYFQTVLAASREAFAVQGTKRYALLELSNVEQRILTDNKIDTQIHEDLLKWRDDYVSAQLRVRGSSYFDVPKPTKNPLWNNLKLSTVKYFRGDERKILHWGLDLSGGKTVQIELRDTNHRVITQEADLRQGINELYRRVNKMGVSEVTIRQEGHLITLDFPGSQHLSAAELVKASSMLFHVVNEKFSPNHGALASYVQSFLQEIWNEAVITNRTEAEDINKIAWKHMYGDHLDAETPQPHSEAAKVLYEQGLRLANPSFAESSSVFDDVYSQIALFRGEDYTSWHGQTHPLLIVFQNYALEGANLENVQASYDPSRGNFLAFGVKGSYTNQENIKVHPRDDFQAWTTPFCKEKVAGTPLGAFSRNLGWRMAVILNGSIVSAPNLESALRDSAMITGSFSQREINQLEADLKAGSLSFAPKILSEKNVSPELGNQERSLGILATILALVLVIVVMISYYGLGGIVASVAVVLNLLIMWAILQNIQATLTLSSLAGLILTVGMAVDANVLVFERIREELQASGRLVAAVHAGYKKAFSAILDSNVTTIIAALVLLQFDSGPIRGFAVTLIIGIISSMFTALFATKFFFFSWVQNPKHKTLKMMNLFRHIKSFDFLRHAKTAAAFSLVVIFLGGIFFVAKQHTLFGMDFTGGYALQVELTPKQDISYRSQVEQALLASGVKSQEMQVRELSPTNHVKIFLSKTLQQPGRPLHGFITPTGFATTTNPQIDFVLSSLEQAHVGLTPAAAVIASQNFAEVSGQMSQTMRNSAILGLVIALFCIFIYIAIRFEYKYALSATVCLAHDLLFTLASIAFLHACDVPVQIDLTTIAALMTIAGYSLNDTIIVFDRIREETKGMKKTGLPGIINHALNITLSRTVLTSSTTLLVLIPLISLGGSTIFGFTLVMSIGIVFGTLSSLFIAAPLMLFFHKREEKRHTIALHI